MPLLWVDARVVLRGLKWEEPDREGECTKEGGSQCQRRLEERREHGKVSWEPREQSHVGIWSPRGQTYHVCFTSAITFCSSTSPFLLRESPRSSKKYIVIRKGDERVGRAFGLSRGRAE